MAFDYINKVNWLCQGNLSPSFCHLLPALNVHLVDYRFRDDGEAETLRHDGW